MLMPENGNSSTRVRYRSLKIEDSGALLWYCHWRTDRLRLTTVQHFCDIDLVGGAGQGKGGNQQPPRKIKTPNRLFSFISEFGSPGNQTKRPLIAVVSFGGFLFVSLQPPRPPQPRSTPPPSQHPPRPAPRRAGCGLALSEGPGSHTHHIRMVGC